MFSRMDGAEAVGKEKKGKKKRGGGAAAVMTGPPTTFKKENSSHFGSSSPVRAAASSSFNGSGGSNGGLGPPANAHSAASVGVAYRIREKGQTDTFAAGQPGWKLQDCAHRDAFACLRLSRRDDKHAQVRRGA